MKVCYIEEIKIVIPKAFNKSIQLKYHISKVSLSSCYA